MYCKYEKYVYICGMQNGNDMNKGFKNTKEWSANDILKMAHSGAVTTSSKWYNTLQVAKQQFGTKAEKIEMAMRYVKFASEQEETECLIYLMTNLK